MARCLASGKVQGKREERLGSGALDNMTFNRNMCTYLSIHILHIFQTPRVLIELALIALILGGKISESMIKDYLLLLQIE